MGTSLHDYVAGRDTVRDGGPHVAPPRIRQTVHSFVAEEFLSGPTVKSGKAGGMVQLIRPDGERDIVCTQAYASFACRARRNWTWERL